MTLNKFIDKYNMYVCIKIEYLITHVSSLLPLYIDKLLGGTLEDDIFVSECNIVPIPT
mgnify:CR=1 FL=1